MYKRLLAIDAPTDGPDRSIAATHLTKFAALKETMVRIDAFTKRTLIFSAFVGLICGPVRTVYEGFPGSGKT